MLTDNFRRLFVGGAITQSLKFNYIDYEGNAQLSSVQQTGTATRDLAYRFIITDALGTTSSNMPFTLDVLSSNTSYYGDGTIVLGSGTTPPTKQDYTLENPLDTSLYLPLKKSHVVSLDSTGVSLDAVITVTMTYQNISENPFTVSEAGMAQKISAQQNSLEGIALTSRDVFAPITVQPGDTFTITIQIG